MPIPKSSVTRTWDGKQLTAGVSGFVSYTTERADTPDHPAPVLTPADLVTWLNDLKKYFNYPDINNALRLLVKHINDHDNPHHTNLDSFTLQVADILYKQFVAQGGKSTKAEFIESLFSALRVASLAEMEEEGGESLLISVAGARQAIRQHENDQTAHYSLLNNLFPGVAPASDPVFSIMADIGLAESYVYSFHEESADETAQENKYVGYTFVDSSRRLCFTDSLLDLPIDHSTGEALIPCFSTRTNVITASGTLDEFRPYNVNVLSDPDQLAPDAVELGMAVTTGKDSTDTKHAIYLEDVELRKNVARSFSIYARAGTCRFLAISFKDMAASDVTTYGIFDLEEGTALAVNHLDRYFVNIVSLTDRWYRCEFTMTHAIGQIDDLHCIFFKSKDGDGLPELTFKGDMETCGHLWGAQLEDGTCASPYMRTTKTAATRTALGVKIDLDPDWWPAAEGTLYINYLYPGARSVAAADRPIFTLTSSDAGMTNVRAEHLADGSVDIRHYVRLATTDADGNPVSHDTTSYQDPFRAPSVTNCQLTHGFDRTGGISRFNETDGLNTAIAGEVAGGDTLWLGCDPQGNCLEGYIRSVTLYPDKVTEDEAAFLNGEKYDE